MKKTNDLSEFQNILPYASELLGVYQPLLGWKSKRMERRFKKGFRADKNIFYPKFLKTLEGSMEFTSTMDVPGTPSAGRSPLLGLDRIGIAEVKRKESRYQSFLIDALKEQLPPETRMTDDTWQALINEENIQNTLDEIVVTQFSRAYENEDLMENIGQIEDYNEMIIQQADKESKIAGYLMELQESGNTDKLGKLLLKEASAMKDMLKLFKRPDPFEVIDPHHDLGRVVISPISIVHIFRQYFFEFDTFLGSPVEHVWLSPGSNVELIETSTRRTLVEKTFESEFDLLTKSEESSKELDELSSSVKEENRRNTKFGFNTEVQQGWVGGSAKASSSLNIDNTQTTAREATHRRVREQSKSLSTQIRKNYKSSFKMVEEVTDTTSKRHLLNNTTDELINYELRRKMRQVGVQVQDVGTYLCWQTFVDDPGKNLGVSKLVHIAEPPDLSSIPAPESKPVPGRAMTEEVIEIMFRPKGDDTTYDDDMDETYRNGKEIDDDTNEGDLESIYHRFGPYEFFSEESGYSFGGVEFDGQGAHIMAHEDKVDASEPGKVSFKVVVKEVNFRNTTPILLKAKLNWVPTDQLLAEVEQENKSRMDQYNAETQRAFELAYVEAARERIKMASEVKSRKFEELREEERIVIYRNLLQEMLTKDLPLNDNRTYHATSELLNSIFDFDKMLYFVTPEWWRPRLHKSKQQMGGGYTAPTSGASASQSGGASSKVGGTATKLEATESMYTMAKSNRTMTQLSVKDPIASTHQVGWGGIHEAARDNYYITEESQPARLGSSLGWLLQLDGDNLRNQFLNSPWVKAVVPIRPGKEKAAFNWLKRLEVEGSEGLNTEYIAPAAELSKIPHTGANVTIEEAIDHLCDVVREKHEDSMKVGSYPPEEINDDNKVSATPIDKVYEHGFYPNQGGFKLDVNEPFEVFDQWIEILPTDQIVPVEVKYDPLTGRQVTD